VIPACMLVYGWSVEKEVGGIPLPVITMFLQGVAQLFCFPSLNTYCLDVMPGRGSEVIAGNYFGRYLFACAATACVLPAVEAIGIGWFSTISAAFLVAATGGTMAAIHWGKGWRDEIDHKRRQARLKGREAAAREELEQQNEDLTEKDRSAEGPGRGSISASADALPDTVDLEKGTKRLDADTK